MTQDPNQAKASPGWYPHPAMAHTVMYWNGDAWTDQIAPAPAAPGATPRPSPPAAKQLSPTPRGTSTSGILFRVTCGVFLVDLAVVVILGYAGGKDGAEVSTVLWWTGILFTLVFGVITFVVWLVELSRPKT